MTEDRRHAAIMFTDIAGYTALMGSDENRAFEVLQKNREIHNKFIEKFNGSLIKEMGDGMLLSFSSSSEAVRCAIDIQKACKEQQIALRIGVHEGESVFTGSDVFGDGVNISSRLQAEATEGSIYVSESIYRNIKNKSDIKTRFIKEKLFKNVDEPIKIYEVLFNTETGQVLDQIQDSKSKKKMWKPSHIMVAVLGVMMILTLLIFPKLFKHTSTEIDRSIAVLPFDNESADEQNVYFVNGMMEDIRNNLAKIGDLRVISKTSTEKYRETNLTIKEIAEELDVSYLLEGTVQKEGNQVKIHAQLIQTNSDDHIWVETYLRDLSDIFSVQGEIAQAIAKELYAVITPEELAVIETIPTSNITAYDIFLRAREQHDKFWLDNRNRNALEEAIVLYHRALEYDSTYAQAYTGLALAYWNKHHWDKYFEATFLDSVLFLTNKALSYNTKLDEAYYVRGMYLANQKNSINEALRDFDQALKINPNYVQVYFQKSIISAWVFNDYVEAIKNREIAVRIDHSTFMSGSLRSLGDLYSQAGFKDLARNYYHKAFQLDNDSVTFYNYISWQNFSEENISGAREWALSAYHLDTASIWSVMQLVMYNSYLGNNEEANRYAVKLVELFETFQMALPGDWHRIGYTFWKLGKTKEADHYFNEQIKWCEESIRLNKPYAETYGAHYDLACVLSLKGKTERAMELLYELNNKKFWPKWVISQFKYEPFFESIRDDARFKKIFQDINSKYQREHDRVKVWLNQEGLL